MLEPPTKMTKFGIDTDALLDNIQNSLEALGSVISPNEIDAAFDRAIRCFLPEANNVKIEWQLQDGTNSGGRGAPNFNIVGRRVISLVGGDEIDTELEKFFLPAPTSSSSYGIICKIQDPGNQHFHCLYAFTLPHMPTDGDFWCLDFLDKQIRIMFNRLQRLQQHHQRSQNSMKEDILDLCYELCDSEPEQLQKKVLSYLLNKTGAETGFLMMRSLDKTELFCQVVGDKILDEEIRFVIDENSFGGVLLKNKPIWLKDCSESQLAELSRICQRPVHNLLCVPVQSRNSGEVIAITCLINKSSQDEFTVNDVTTVRTCFQYTSAVLTSCIAYQTERRLKDQTQTMLDVAMKIFRRLDDLTSLLQEIMAEAKILTKAERCSVFLLENETQELVSKVFDGLPAAKQKEMAEIRIPVTQGIAGFVATSGEMLNIADAYSHPLFYRGVDEETGYRTRNILCFPLKDENEVIIGVAQLCNKVNGTHFTTYDEEIARAFAVYCCISIVHSLMYKKVQDAQHRSQLAYELMTYHMKVTDEKVTWLTRCEIPSTQLFLPDFDRFESVPRHLKEDDSILSVLSMFEQQGIISRLRVRRSTLARFILMVKRGYRDPPYHNWSHAFTVGHFIYLCTRNFPLNEQLTELELAALFVASLCHDIDHRGTNNSFQVESKSVLSALYSSGGSVLERHHFSQTVCILNTEGCNVFENLTRQDYQHVMDLIREIILATDLVHHLGIMGELREMAESGYEPDNPKHHNLLLCILMTSADLSDQTKGWDNAKVVAELLYREFFGQGDMEKALGNKPMEYMDRERAVVPDLQISFLDSIALPCFRILARMYPQCNCIIQNMESTRSKWFYLGEQVKEGKLGGRFDEIFNNSVADLM